MATDPVTVMVMIEAPPAPAALYGLLTWMSPAWPIGAYAHSGGLEWAVGAGIVADRSAAVGWIGEALAHGTLWADAVLFTHAFRATLAADRGRLRDVADLAAASLGGFERHLEATAQGAAFRRIARAAAPVEALGLLDAVEDDDLAYPVAAACLMAGHGIGPEAALTAFLHGAVANLVSAAQRLIPLGQTEAQRAIAALGPAVGTAVARAMALGDGDPFDAMGSITLIGEIACMAHETQYTRLFRT